MNISGVMVQVAPAKIDQVKAALLALRGVDIPVEDEEGRLVVIIEENGAAAAGEALMKMQSIEGVLSASLVYQHVADEENPEGA